MERQLASSLSLPPTAFAPSAATAAEMGLEKALRILPHQQDTGGFFVCSLRRVASDSGVGGGIGTVVPRPIGLAKPSRKQRKKQQKRAEERAWQALRSAEQAAALQHAAEFFSFSGSAPFRGGGHFFRRDGSDSVALLTAGAAGLVSAGGTRLLSAGAAVLEGAPSVIPQGSLALVLRWMAAEGGRVVRLPLEAMSMLLEVRRRGSHGGRLRCVGAEPAGDGACAVGVAAAAAVSQWGPGGCVAVLDGGDSEADARPAVALSCVKTEPDWLRVCGQDKAALAAVSRELRRRAASSPPA